MIFDPCNRFFPEGGVRHKLSDMNSLYQPIHSACAFSMPGRSEDAHSSFIRLPLRINKTTKLRGKPIRPDDIKHLLMKFIEEELSEVLLFLRSVRTVYVGEISEDDRMVVLAKSSIAVLDEVSLGSDSFSTATVSMEIYDSPPYKRTWWRNTTVSTLKQCEAELEKVMDGYTGIKSDLVEQKLTTESISRYPG